MVALCCCCNKKSKGKIDDATKVSEPLIKSAAEKSDDEDSIGSDYESQKIKKNVSWHPAVQSSRNLQS